MTNHSYFSFLCRTITALFFFQLLWITYEYKMTIIICNKTCSLLYKCSYTILFLCRTMRTVTLLKVFDGNHLKTSVNEQMFLWLKMYLNRYFTLIWRFFLSFHFTFTIFFLQCLQEPPGAEGRSGKVILCLDFFSWDLSLMIFDVWRKSPSFTLKLSKF